MNTRHAAAALAMLGGAAALLMPGLSHAGNVGYYNGCPYFTLGDPAGVISAAGHVKVPVTTLDAPSLSGLAALLVTDCYSGQFNAPNAALNTAVANGMGLVFERMGTNFTNNTGIVSTGLPGAPTFSASAIYAYPEANNIEIATGAPIATGPGGTLTASSLDRGTPTVNAFNMVYWYPGSSLPTGAIRFLTTANPDHVGAFGYPVGAGRVVYSDTQFMMGLPGGVYAGQETFYAGGAIYLSNAIAWATGYVATTCASSGYTGTKLTWCQNVCEKGYTGATLNSWIRRWWDQYHTYPYCAAP